jgi:hypothetical protein
LTDIRERLVAPCANRIIDATRSSDEVSVDLGALVRRIILFDKYILQSVRLMEIPHLLPVFGFNGTITLLQSGLIDLECDSTIIGQAGQNAPVRGQKRAFSLKSYWFFGVEPANRTDYLDSCLRAITGLHELSNRQRRRLRNAVVDAIVDRPQHAGRAAFEQFLADLSRNIPTVATATTSALQDHLGRSVNPGDFSLRLHQIEEARYQVESDVGQRFHLDEWTEHKIIEKGLLAVAHVNERIEHMQRYEALSRSRQGDLPVFAGKFEFLHSQLSPEPHESTFSRVLTIAGLPEIETGRPEQYVDVNRLIEITQTSECRTFRQWLRNVQTATDEEIRDQFHPLGDRLSAALRSTSARAVRFLVTTAASYAPDVGMAAGTALSALDSFVVDNIIARPGPASFLSRLYPSIFE